MNIYKFFINVAVLCGVVTRSCAVFYADKFVLTFPEFILTRIKTVVLPCVRIALNVLRDILVFIGIADYVVVEGFLPYRYADFFGYCAFELSNHSHQ